MGPLPTVVRYGARVSFCTLALFFAPTAPHVSAAESSEPAALAAKSLLLDVVNTGDKIVAVGDHGNVVISRDNGLTWIQSIAPTRTLLTAVSFPDSQHGWAVGHDGVIIATQDGGATWERQDQGKDTETVFLDVHFLNPKRGFAVGAYGKFQATADGGKTWTVSHPSDKEIHFNRLSVARNGTLYLAGESGTLLSSHDGGKTWAALNVPYDGSLFGALPLQGDALVVYGLRGHILRSDDEGHSWEPLNSDLKVLIMGGILLKGGVILLGGQGGNFFISRDKGHSFESWKPADFDTSLADLVEANDGGIVTVGEAGAVRLKLP